MQIYVRESISNIDAGRWNGLLNDGNPFLRHEFLLALEESGSVGRDAGWEPRHLVCESADGELLGALPLYLKDNSYGEFVFDFSWASAYQQAGIPYYPKLVSSVPYTPATGARILVAAEQPDRDAIRSALLVGARAIATEAGISSFHVLFPEADEIPVLQQADFRARKDCQFHWHNRDYASFDDFLAGFTSAKRKKTRRDRRHVSEAGIRFEVKTGHDLSDADWLEIMPLYRTTFIRRGREPYLGEEFFRKIAVSMPESLIVFLGYEGSSLVAVAICFRSDTTLYGRYWGANRFIDSLHFETCYYQGIEYCIQQGLDCFEPGTQGEHKISRGFVPTETWSAHWLSHPQFAAAVDNYLEREREHIDRYIDAVGSHVPYRKETD